MLREFPFGADGDFSQEKFLERYEADLANDLGNLVQRVLKMVQKNKVKVIKKSAKTLEGTEKDIENLDFKTALDKIWDIIITANQEIDKAKPWELAKKDVKKLEKFLNEWTEKILIIANALASLLPLTSQKIKKQVETLEIKPLFPKN